MKNSFYERGEHNSLIKCSAFTQKGRNRDKNEDRVLIETVLLDKTQHCRFKDNVCIVAICDGVGKNKGGDAIAEQVLNYLSDSSDSIRSTFELTKRLNEINNKIRDSKAYKKESATTLAGIVINDEKYMAFNIGDTRIYRYRNSNLELLSKDHTLAQAKLDIVGDNEKDYIKQTDYNILTDYIGNSTISPNIVVGSVKDNDLFIICSDGIYKHIEENMGSIQQLLNNNTSIHNIIEMIANYIIKNKCRDDASILLLQNCA